MISFPQSDCQWVKSGLLQQKWNCSPCDFCTGVTHWGVRDSSWVLLLPRHRNYRIYVNSKQEWIHLLCKCGCTALVRRWRWISMLTQQYTRKFLLKETLKLMFFSRSGSRSGATISYGRRYFSTSCILFFIFSTKPWYLYTSFTNLVKKSISKH